METSRLHLNYVVKSSPLKFLFSVLGKSSSLFCFYKQIRYKTNKNFQIFFFTKLARIFMHTILQMQIPHNATRIRIFLVKLLQQRSIQQLLCHLEECVHFVECKYMHSYMYYVLNHCLLL